MSIGLFFHLLGLLVILLGLIGLVGFTADIRNLHIAFLFFGMGWLLGGVTFPFSSDGHAH